MSTRRVTAPMLAFKHAWRIRASPDQIPGTVPMCPVRGLPTVEETTREEDGMQAQRIDRARVHSPAGTAARWAVVIAAAGALAACGTPRAAAAAPGGSVSAVKTLTYYAFDI